ncbi:hypothetical protein RugamoR57_37310 [Duganella caerulea]|uniref:hypothetical protein n=1 Tax=Duganella caerulea TaxID=2885762 RepID=UPI0030EAA208
MNTTTTHTSADYRTLRGGARNAAFLELITASPAACDLMARLARQVDALIEANPWRYERPAGQLQCSDRDDRYTAWTDACCDTFWLYRICDSLTYEQNEICRQIFRRSAKHSAYRPASERGNRLIETLLVGGTIDVLRLAAAQQELELA